MQETETAPPADPLWYKDAIIYELHVKTFHDSDGDGIGDFRGAIEKLDYLRELGITAIWLLPFYPSPLRDDGYDIADYYDVHPSYGRLEDFRAFLGAAHERGLRVITELVINHTSDQNPEKLDYLREPGFHVIHVSFYPSRRETRWGMTSQIKPRCPSELHEDWHFRVFDAAHLNAVWCVITELV